MAQCAGSPQGAFCSWRTPSARVTPPGSRAPRTALSSPLAYRHRHRPDPHRTRRGRTAWRGDADEMTPRCDFASVREVMRPPPADHAVQRIGEIVVLVFDANAQRRGNVS